MKKRRWISAALSTAMAASLLLGAVPVQASEVEEITWMFWDDLEATEDLITKGYKEVVEYLNGNCSYSTMRDVIKQNTRNYAKRQITFFKKLPGIVWLDPKADDNEKKVEEMLCRIQKN